MIGIWILDIILLLLTGKFRVVDLGSPAETISVLILLNFDLECEI